MTTTADSKTLEKRLSDAWSMMVYAVIADMDNARNDGNPYDPLIFQNYSNLLKPKEEKLTGLTGRFTVSIEVKQLLAILFKEYIGELEDLVWSKEDTTETMITRTLNVGDAWCNTIHNAVLQNSMVMGPTLAGYCDKQDFVGGVLKTNIESLTHFGVQTALLADLYVNFLKVMALKVGALNWHAKVTVSKKLFSGAMAISGFTQLQIELACDFIRPKASTRPRSMLQATRAAAAAEKTAYRTKEAARKAAIKVDDANRRAIEAAERAAKAAEAKAAIAAQEEAAAKLKAGTAVPTQEAPPVQVAAPEQITAAPSADVPTNTLADASADIPADEPTEAIF